MSQTATAKPTGAAFRDMISTPDTGNLMGVALLFLLSLAFIPLAGNQTLCLIYAAACAVALYLLSRSLSYVISMLLPAAVLYFLTGSLTLPVIFAALLLGGSCGTILLLTCRNRKYILLWCAAPVFAYLAAYLLLGQPLPALAVLLPLPLAIGGTLLIRRYTPQTTAIAVLAALLAATLAVAGLAIMLALDMLHGNPLTVLADTLRSSLSDTILSTLAEMRTLYAETGMELPITDADAISAVSTLINLLPGLFLALTVVVAFFVWRATLNLLVNLRMLPRVPLRMSLMLFSPVTAVVYLLAFLTDLIGNASEITLAGTVGANLALVLTPGLALLGFASLSRRNGNRSCLSVLLFVGLVITCLTNPLTGLSLAAALGAIHVLLTTFLPKTGSTDVPPEK